MSMVPRLWPSHGRHFYNIYWEAYKVFLLSLALARAYYNIVIDTELKVENYQILKPQTNLNKTSSQVNMTLHHYHITGQFCLPGK